MKRRGSMLLEVAIAISLIVVALVGVSQLLVVASRQRRETRSREIAIMEVGNLMERVSQIPYRDLTEERVSTLALSEHVQAELSEGTLRVDLETDPEWRDAKRIVVAIDWVNSAGRRVAPIELTGWAFSADGEASE